MSTTPMMAITKRRISSARNTKLEVLAQTPVTTNSEPLITSLFDNNLNIDDEKTRRKSSALPHEMVKIKSIAAGHIAKEMRRHSMAEKLNVPPPTEGETIETTSATEEDTEATEYKLKILPCLPAVSTDVPEFGDGNKVVASIRYIFDWFLFIASFPFLCMFTWTIPNCSKVHTRKYFLLSFFASIIWIAILSFGMVTLVGRVGCILNVDKFTMGLVVIAIGTSIPDALSSIIVARDGYGDMAVSNAIGSNVFDIDLGIGLPFVLKCLIQNLQPIMLLSKKDQVLYDSGEMTIVPHAKFGFILLLILFLAIGVFCAVKFRLGRTVGASFFLMYLLFVTYAYLQDLLCNHDC